MPVHRPSESVVDFLRRLFSIYTRTILVIHVGIHLKKSTASCHEQRIERLTSGSTAVLSLIFTVP